MGSHQSALEFYDLKSHRLFRSYDFRLVVRKGRLYALTTTPSGLKVFRVLGAEYIEVEFQSGELSDELIELCNTVNQEAAKYLASHSWELYKIPPDSFEKLVAEILASFGFEIQLNVRLFDNRIGDEADIVAFRKVRGMEKPVGYVVECKRYAEHRKVNLQIATRLYGVKQLHARNWGLDRALLATTSTMTTDVVREYGNRWDFEIADHHRILEWLKAYSEQHGLSSLAHQDLRDAAKDLFLTSCNLLKHSQ